MPASMFNVAFGYIVKRGLAGNWDVVRRRGWRRTLARMPSFVRATAGILQSMQFDRTHGVDTCGQIAKDALDISSANRALGFGFGSTPIGSFHRLMRKLGARWSEFAFIDFGSGKGRTLCLAAEYSFQRIIGVEYARDLHSIAVQNLSGFSSTRQKCFALSAVCEDAATFSPPSNIGLFAYFYTPFSAELLEQVLQNLATEAARTQSRLIVCITRQAAPGAPDIARALDRLPQYSAVLKNWQAPDPCTHPALIADVFELRTSAPG